MSDEEIKRGYLVQHGREMQPIDLQAFKDFMVMFDCEDSETYEEADARILASMEMLSEEAEGRQ